MMPALLTRMSQPPKSFATRSPRALTSSALRDVGPEGDDAAPSGAELPRGFLGPLEILPARHHDAVARARRASREIARPIPREPPVTMAVFMAPP